MNGKSFGGLYFAFLISPLFFQIQTAYSDEGAAAPPEAVEVSAAAGEEAEKEEYDSIFGSWGGLKDTWAESGVTVEAAVTGNVMGLVSGGLDRGLYPTFAYQLTTTLDTETAGLWKGGTFMLSGVALTGEPLHNKVGDFQWSNNIDSLGVDTLQVYEAWYEHSFLDGDATLLVGLHDYNSEFYYLDYGVVLLNSSFGFGIDVSQSGNSTYPITSPAIRLRVQPTENSYVVLAAYDAVPGSRNNYGRQTISVTKKDGAFLAAEVGLTSAEEDSVTDYFKIALGGWYQTTDYIDYAERERDDNGGGYIIGERKVFSECDDPAQGLGVFGQFGVAPGSRNTIAQYIGGGLNYTGLIPGRDEDVAAAGVAGARVGNDYLNRVPDSRRAETALEISYRINVAKGVAIQPDVQYIINPGFTTEQNHAVVVGTRIDIVF